MAEPSPVLTALRLLRLARGITQAQVAAAIGATRITVNRWEIGSAAPPLAGTIAYARLLGLRVTFELEEPPDDVTDDVAPSREESPTRPPGPARL